MEFHVLGPLEVEDGGRRVALGGPKPRALLAILLLRRGEVVPVEQVIEQLYDGVAPARATNSVHAHVSRLRKALGDTRLRTAGGGYVLELEPGSLDLDRFDELVRQGRDALGAHDPAAASSALAEALALWRGPALADFRYEDFAQSDIAKLEERRLAAVEDRIDAELELARHGEVVAEVEALVREHPLRERLRAQLMLALYRSGRQAEALDAYQDARCALTEELGIEPSRSLRDLQQAILEQRAGLELETPTHAETPPPRPSNQKTKDLPAAAGRDGRPERKTVTVLHVQLRVSSADGDDVDPEVLRNALGAAFGEIAAAVEAHEGTIDGITADSIRGVFGLPVAHEDDPARAVRAADEIRLRLEPERLGDESIRRLEARIGVSTGEVMTGGTSDSRPAATGAPLTRAGQLAQEAKPDEVILDDATQRAVATRRDAGRFTSPMVGRTRERRRMHDAFEQAVGDSSCQLFTILGAAGVGKSRLVQEFLGDLSERALVARGRCLPYGEGITFWPVLEAIKDVAGVDEAEAPDVTARRLAAVIDDTEDAHLIAQRVATVVGLAEATGGGDEGFEAVRAFFEALASRTPLLVVFDDVHWGEPTFLDLVEHLADWSRGVPILLLCLARPELLDVRGGWGGGKLNSTSVLLEPLSDAECTELVANLVGEAELAEEVETQIASAAEGNPLFVEEVLSMLIDDGILVREASRWIAAGDITAFPIPPTIQALLAARLDQLTGHERAAIEPAAVEGKVFHESSVAMLTPNVNASPALASLVRKELIRPDRPVFAGERAFRFRHLMIRDAAYDAIPKEARAELHERHVDWLEEKTREHSVEFDEIVGYHLEQAYRYRAELAPIDAKTSDLGRQAAGRLGTAGRRAFLRSDAPAGAKLISRAVALLPADDPLRVELVPNVRVVQGLGDLSWADRVLTDAVEAAATTGNRRLAAHALVQRGLLRLFVDADVTPAELFDLSERAIAAFEDLGDELGLARAWRLIAQAHYLDRRAEASAGASERALEHARRSRDVFEQREIVEWLGIALLLGPTPAADARRRSQELIEEFSEHPLVAAELLAVLAPLAAMSGDVDKALEEWRRARKIMDEADEWIWISSFWYAFIHDWAGRPAEAEPELRPAYEALKRAGAKSHFSSIAHALAAIAYSQGRYDEAEALTHECEGACRANDVHSHVAWRAIRAKVLARRGELAEAESLSREAVAYALDSDFLLARSDALADFAEVLLLAGREDEAASELADAIHVDEKKGNALLARARQQRFSRLLEETRSPSGGPDGRS